MPEAIIPYNFIPADNDYVTRYMPGEPGHAKFGGDNALVHFVRDNYFLVRCPAAVALLRYGVERDIFEVWQWFDTWRKPGTGIVLSSPRGASHVMTWEARPGDNDYVLNQRTFYGALDQRLTQRLAEHTNENPAKILEKLQAAAAAKLTEQAQAVAEDIRAEQKRFVDNPTADAPIFSVNPIALDSSPSPANEVPVRRRQRGNAK